MVVPLYQVLSVSTTLRQILAVICLAAFVCGGAVNVCACDLVPPEKACASHDHSHEDDQEKPATDSESTCPCATCHSCHHVTVVLPAPVAELITDGSSVLVPDAPVAAIMAAADIFTPPKLA